MTDNEYRKTRKAAVDALIYWAKTGMRQFTMRDAVNNHLEASGANRPLHRWHRSHPRSQKNSSQSTCD